MRTIRVAAVLAAAVGLGVLAVGCGPQPDTGKGGDTSKVAKATEKGINPVTLASDKAAQVGDLAGKVKAATDDINKELTPLKDAFEKLKAKVSDDEKAAGGDATKLTKVFDLKKTRDDADKLLKEITEKIGGLAGVKDAKSLDDGKKAVLDLIEKVKPLLKDSMPAK